MELLKSPLKLPVSPDALVCASPAAPLSRLQRRCAWTLWLTGGLLRLLWIVVIHPPMQSNYSDMAGYIDRARNLFGPRPESIADTIFPPGTHILFGLLARVDPAFNLAALSLWLLSLGTMGLVWLIARRLYGNRTALIALGLTALYPALINYAGLFMSETPLTFSLLLSFWLMLHASRMQGLLLRAGGGLLAGLALGLAASFKNTVMVPFLLLAGFGGLWSLRHRQGWRWLPLGVGVTVGVAAVFVPMAQRCTALSEGRFCPGANNIAMNVLMGHYGRNGPYHWHDEVRHFDFEFQSPSASLRGYTQKIWLPFGAYDSAPNLAAALEWTRAHPREALGLSVDNLGDLLFAPSIWPQMWIGRVDLGAWGQRYFWLLILAPAVLQLVSRSRSMLRLATDTLPEWLLLLPVIGLMATVFVSIGEVRHRVPFDPLLIMLAAQGYAPLGKLMQRFRHPAELERKTDSPLLPAESFQTIASRPSSADNPVMQTYKKTFLKLALQHEVLKFGSFTLKSGRISPYFFNLGKISSGAALRQLAHAYVEALDAQGIEFDLLFGPAYKGIPLAAAIACAYAEKHGRDLPFAYNRKEAKAHGEGGVLVGAEVSGKRVVVVDDVLTAGTALRESHAQIVAAGGVPILAVTALDRQETGPNGRAASAELQEQQGFPVISLVSVQDLLDYLQDEAAKDPAGNGQAGQNQNGLVETVAAIREYQGRYGISARPV